MIVFDLLAIVAPVFACAAIGWIWAKLGRSFDSETVTGLVVTIGTPCLVFDTLTRLELSLAAFGQMALATVLAVAGFGAVAVLWLWAARLGRAAFLPALMFPNAGNMGLPIALFAFGDTGLALAVAYFGVMVMLQFTIGVAIAAGSVSPRMLLTSPIVYAVAAAVLVIAFEAPIPPVVGKTVNLLAGFTIPVMLIALGVSLAKLRISSLGDSLAIAVTRLLLGFGVGTAVAWGLGLPPVAAGVVIIQSSMPVAVFSYLFALRYGRSPEALAGAVVLSTLLAFAFLPVVLWLVLPG
ncbi:MAG: AEC family transporter [Alphaproteobacteria bacterium]|nr:AEC family transporter [Alphaproteobacteria bacterium]